MILRRAWLYMFIVGLTVALYGWFLLRGHPALPGSGGARVPAGPTVVVSSVGPAEPMSESMPQLLAAARERPALLLALAACTLVGVLLLVGGVLVTIQRLLTGRAAALLSYRSRLPFRWPLRDCGRILVLLACVAMLLPFAQLGLMAWNLGSVSDAHTWSLSGMFVIHGLLILLVLGFAGANGVTFSGMFGLTPDRVGPAVRRSLVSYLTAFPWIFGLLAVVAGLAERMGFSPPTEPIQELIFGERRVPIVVATAVLACFVGPVAEEVFFRGILYSSLRSRWSRGLAMLVSGSIFAAVHTNIIGFLPILLLGVLLADCYERTGSLAGPIAVHIVHNGFLMATALVVRMLKG